MSQHEDIAVLRIELEEIEPLIWRRVAVPAAMNLKSLHDVIQAAMGWFNYHLWEFEVGDRAYGVPDPDGIDWGKRTYKAQSLRLSRLVESGVRAFGYAYDFGDDWHHRVVVEAVETAEPDVHYPWFLGGERRCPPEDVGGVPGYYDFLDAIAKPRSRQGRSLLDWYGGPYDPDDIDEEQIPITLKRIASRWRPGRAGGAAH